MILTISEKIERLKKLNKTLIPEKKEEKARLFSAATGNVINYEKIGSSPVNNSNSQDDKDALYSNASIELDNLIHEREQLIYDLNSKLNEIRIDSHRRAAKLYFIDGLSIKAIANKRMHCTYETIKNYIYESRKSIENNDQK